MWPFRKKTTPFQTWPIVRTKPDPKKYGRAISLFINNWQCHLTTIDVFSDGAVDCWGFVDLALFREKVRSRWVVPRPQENQHLSVFNFGVAGMCRGEWWQTPARIVAEVESIVAALNTGRVGLVDMQGDDSEPYGKIRRSKMGLSDKKPFRENPVEGEFVGNSVPILRVNADHFELTNIFPFRDGAMRIGPQGSLLPLEKVKALYECTRSRTAHRQEAR